MMLLSVAAIYTAAVSVVERELPETAQPSFTQSTMITRDTGGDYSQTTNLDGSDRSLPSVPNRASSTGEGIYVAPDMGPPLVPAVPAPSAEAVHPPSTAAALSSDARNGSDEEGDIVVTGRKRHAPGDPLERMNKVSFATTQKVDDAVTGPAARAYKHVVPHPIRQGIRGFLNNLREPIVAINYMVQLRPGKAAETLGRLAINTTLGLGGINDVASRCPFNLPWRPNGFSETLGVLGMGRGPFLFVPLIGPTTIRDLIGGAVDRVASPWALGGVFKSQAYLASSNGYRVLDRRAEQDDELRRERENADPYASRRDRYFAKQQNRLDRVRGLAPASPREDPDPGRGLHVRRCSKAPHAT